MEYSAIKVEQKTDLKVLEITIDRIDAKNAINQQLISELNQALDIAEENPAIRTIVLKGNDTFFCTGMDFKEASKLTPEQDQICIRSYATILKRFSEIPKTVVSICEGKVQAGGIGFAAASDIVIAHPTATFCLPEVLWGLLPANVMPYLIRRAGFQPSYFMTLTTKNLSAKEAKEFHLVDIVSEEPYQEFAKLNNRLSLVNPQTLLRMKSYFRKMWIVNEEMEELAINTLAELKQDPLIQKNIKKFTEHGKLPWEE